MKDGITLRVIGPVAAVSLLLLGLAVGASVYLSRLQEKTSQLVSENIGSVRAAEELEISLRELRYQLHLFVITGDRAHLDAVPRLRRSTDSWLSEAERLASTPREQALCRRVRQGYETFIKEFDRIAGVTAQAGRPPFEGLSRDVFELVERVLTREILAPAHEYLDTNEELIQESNVEQQALTRRLTLAMLLLGGGGAAWGLTAGFLLARRLGRSFIQLRVPIHDAAGKLNEVVGPVEVDAGQSLEQLEMALQKLADQVSAVVARLQESQREALRAEQMACVGQLAAGIAHELRNPLTAVKMLLEGNREEAAARGMPLEDFDVIEQEVGRLERRLQQFLDFARPPRLERRPVELGNLVRQTLGLVCGRARQQNVQLEVTALCPPIVAEADAEQLRQVFVNLALNALDAMPRGGVLEFLLSPPANGYAEVVVQDTGPGIAPALLPRLFEPFVSGKETGLGLGLVVSRRIVESHGGSLTAANQPQGGARFVLRLPLGKSEKENPKPEVRNPKSEIRNPKQERASLPSDFGFSSFGFS